MAYKARVLETGAGGTGLNAAGAIGNVLTSDGSVWTSAAPAGGGIPTIGTSTDNALVRWDGTGGTAVQNGVITEDDTGNLTQSASVSGAALSITTSNTSNTASSVAKNQLTVAGTSAGDAFQTFTVSGTTNWSQGVDNSASDSFVISASTALGTTNVMSIATTGEINMPLQSAFLAYRNLDVADVTGDGTVYTIIFNVERYDQNADFNTTTGTFTAPVTGKYLFVCELGLEQLGAAHTSLELNLVTSDYTFGLSQLNPGVIISGSDLALTTAAYGDMDATDTATITVTVSGSTKTVDLAGGVLARSSRFGAALIC